MMDSKAPHLAWQCPLLPSGTSMGFIGTWGRSCSAKRAALGVGLPALTPRIDLARTKIISNQPTTPTKRSHLPCYALGHFLLP